MLAPRPTRLPWACPVGRRSSSPAKRTSNGGACIPFGRPCTSAQTFPREPVSGRHSLASPAVWASRLGGRGGWSTSRECRFWNGAAPTHSEGRYGYTGLLRLGRRVRAHRERCAVNRYEITMYVASEWEWRQRWLGAWRGLRGSRTLAMTAPTGRPIRTPSPRSCAPPPRPPARLPSRRPRIEVPAVGLLSVPLPAVSRGEDGSCWN